MKAANDAIYDSPGPLQAYRVGVEAVYAAYDQAQAMDLANRDYGYACFSLSDAVHCDSTAAELLLYSAAGALLGPLRRQLVLTFAPGYLGSYEP
jgi:hypothetical protein